MRHTVGKAHGRKERRCASWRVACSAVLGSLCTLLAVRAFTRDAGVPRRFDLLRQDWRDRAMVNARSLEHLSTAGRLERLEMIVESHTGWLPRPHRWIQKQCDCPAAAIQYEGTDFLVCPDRLEQLRKLAPIGATAKPALRAAGGDAKERCLVYDFGIRDIPTLGLRLIELFGCEVHAFDPSPISIEYFNGDSERSDRGVHLLEKVSPDTSVNGKAASLAHTGPGLKGRTENPLYFFHPWGAGGIDGVEDFFEYNWQQISIMRPGYRPHPLNHSEVIEAHPAVRKLPVRTLAGIMASLGHTGRRIDVLKLDIEGSEYLFLEEVSANSRFFVFCFCFCYTSLVLIHFSFPTCYLFLE